MHIGLIKYLNVELRKKRTPKELIYFIRDVAKRYLKVNLQEYKNLFLVFDPEYQKQKKEFEKNNKAKQDVINALKLLKYSRDKMKKAGISRQRIRRFFLDLSRDEDALNKLVDDLMKEA
jgi:hypothetical protein